MSSKVYRLYFYYIFLDYFQLDENTGLNPFKACVQLHVLRGVSTSERYSKPIDDSPSSWRKGI